MTVWHWVRHGPTHAKTFVGWRDIAADLTDHARLEQLRAHLPKKAIMVASDLKRASHTATALSAPGRKRLPDQPQLREIHLGAWDGKPFDDISNRYPDLSRAFWESPGDIMPPGGESWNHTSARVSACVAKINACHSESQIIAVVHIGVILTQVQRATGLSGYDTLSHKIDNLSVTTIDWKEMAPQLISINHTP
jgi:broad specificity phosphatase PhoE